jgi:hypothetical protein
MNAMMRILLRPSDCGGTGLSFTFWVPQRIYFVYEIEARAPTTFSELSSVVAFGNLFFLSSRELRAITPPPAGVLP